MLAVVCAVPRLVPPDAVVYELGGRAAMVMLCTAAQRARIARGTGCAAGRVGGAEYLYADEPPGAPYRPLGGHYGHYCVAYNPYALRGDGGRYDERLDPWSARFFYRRGGGGACYRGVAETTRAALRQTRQRVHEYLKVVRNYLPGGE